MKKKVLFALILSLLISGTAWASSLNGDYKGNPIVLVKSGNNTLTDEVPAQIIDGKTMVPLTMLRNLGVEVTWNQNDYSVNVKMPSQVEPVSGKKSLTSKDIAKLMDRVATVITYDQYGRPLSQGSGFIIDAWGLLITNSHVMQGAYSWDVILNGVTYHHNWFIFANTTNDVYGLYSNSDPVTGKVPSNVSMKFLPFSAKLPEIGDKVFSIGSPKGLSNSISEGIVSGIRNNNGRVSIQHTAFIDHGSSGGVLLNDQGEAIGVTSSGYEGTTLDFAVPMMYVQQELDKLSKK